MKPGPQFRNRSALLLLVWVLLGNPLGLPASDDLKVSELQDRIDATVAKVMPAVVAVSDRGGTFSAVIVSRDGFVLSAGHAVVPNRRYTIILSDGRRVPAKGLGSNEQVDCAMLKITETGPWPFAEMGVSADLVANQPCLSISHPGRYDSNRGAVIRLGYIVDPTTSNQGMIQSTAKMEPGDSGGPLVDLQGRVIGIHSNIRRTVDRNYEVPIDAFRRFWDQLNEPERFRVEQWPLLPKLGLQVERIDDRQGARVTDLNPEGIATRSGLKLSDIIVACAGKKVLDNERLGQIFREQAIANRSSIPLTVERGDQQVNLSLDVSTGNPAPQVLPAMRSLEKSYAQLEAKLDDMVVPLSSDVASKPVKAWATRIRNNRLGNLISKSSLVGDNPRIQLGEQEVAAQVVKRDKRNDLVLLMAKLPGDAGIDLQAQAGDLQQRPGRLLMNPSPIDGGEISVWGSRYFNVPRSRNSSGYLGVQVANVEGQVVLNSVLPNLAARRGGLEDGDVVLKINDQQIDDSNQMIQFLSAKDPHEEISILVSRDGSELKKTIRLGPRPEATRHVADNLPGGKSVRRDGFDLVISHDADLRPEHCGGPVFDLEGNFLGINMSRFSRTRSYVVPQSVLKRFAQ